MNLIVGFAYTKRKKMKKAIPQIKKKDFEKQQRDVLTTSFHHCPMNELKMTQILSIGNKLAKVT